MMRWAIGGRYASLRDSHFRLSIGMTDVLGVAVRQEQASSHRSVSFSPLYLRDG